MGFSAVVAVIGLATSLTAAQQQAKAQKAQARYRAAVARNNATLAERAAADALARGKIAERRRAIQTRQATGRQRTLLAGAGQLVDEGSALDVTLDTAAIGAQDALTIRSNAQREALGFQQRGVNFQADAGLFDLTGKQAQDTANIQSASAVVSSANSVAGNWYDYNRATGRGFAGAAGSPRSAGAN
jgi:hypothetical protein